MKYTVELRKTDGTTRVIENVERIFATNEEIYLAQTQETTEYDFSYRPIRYFRSTDIVEITIKDEFGYELYKKGEPD